MTAESVLNLADEFSPVSKQQWIDKATADLKGKPLERLTSKLYEGCTIQPLYLAEDAPPADWSGVPGVAPLVRNGQAMGQSGDGWDIRQALTHPCVRTAASQALEDLNGGCSSLSLRLHHEARAAGADPQQPSDQGILLQRLPDFETLLAGIRCDWIRIRLDAGASALPAAAALVAYYQQQGLNLAEVQAELNIDPLSTLMEHGALPGSAAQAMADAAAVAAWCAQQAPQVQALTASGRAVHEAGGTAVQEMAVALASAVAYLRAAEQAGLSPAQAQSQVVLELAVGCDQFTEIAKLRAMRALWSRVLTASGVAADGQVLRLSAAMGERSLSAVDPWVNMLRGTVSGFAAAVGGADSMTIAPYDQRFGPADTLARRIARNTQVILNEESHLAQVIDPGGGSWYLESLTKDLVDQAWQAFVAIEKAGGLLAVLESGSLLDEIGAVVAQRQANISKRKDPLTGVSEFANVSERLPQRPPLAIDALAAEAIQARTIVSQEPAVGAALAACTQAPADQRWPAAIAAVAAGAPFGAVVSALSDGQQATVQPLPAMHLADAFEALRRASTRHQQAAGQLPRVFLATIGPVAKHTLRAGFARNFFAAGGIEAVDPSPAAGYADGAARLSALAESGCSLVCICGSDADYLEHLPALVGELKQAGAKTVVLAGKPPAEEAAAWQQAGLDHAIFMGCPVVSLLREVLTAEGVQL